MVDCHNAALFSPSDQEPILTAKKPRATAADKRSRAIWKRTQMLVEILIEVMETEITNEDAQKSERWLRLFGAKDSAVVNLQKLVQVMIQLQDGIVPSAREKVAPVDADEMAILSAWLQAQSVQ